MTRRWDASPIQSHNAPFSAPIVFPVDPTEEGILADDAVDGFGVEPTETLDGNSLFDENEEIMALERRDFDDILDGIDFDLVVTRWGAFVPPIWHPIWHQLDFILFKLE